jgi:hypothetical protein
MLEGIRGKEESLERDRRKMFARLQWVAFVTVLTVLAIEIVMYIHAWSSPREGQRGSCRHTSQSESVCRSPYIEHITTDTIQYGIVHTHVESQNH